MQTKGRALLLDGREFRMKGYNLGNFLMLERYMFGFPGVDQLFRRYFLEQAGQENYDAFFDCYYNAYFSEADAAFLGRLGCNTLRIPFNYRVFESDGKPFTYSELPFRQMDRVIALCAAHGIKSVIDFHAAPGYENDSHCSDNYTGSHCFYHDAFCQERFIRLWRHIAEHYRGNGDVAAFDLLNEPDPMEDEKQALKDLYRRLIAAVREVDKERVLFLEGYAYSNDFSGFEDLAGENIAFSPHYYPLRPDYFGLSAQERYDRVERDLDARDRICRELEAPCWFGEVGAAVAPHHDEKLEYLDLILDSLERRGHSWSVWSYKDLYRYGALHAKGDCLWREKTKAFIELKQKYRCDVSKFEDWDATRELFRMVDGDFPPKDATHLKQRLWNSTVNTVAAAMAKGYAGVFAGQSRETLRAMADCFAFENCAVEQGQLDVVKRHL